jgi:hypothetical protein
MPACGSPIFSPERAEVPATPPPQLEQPDATFGALDAFIRKNPGRPAA